MSTTIKLTFLFILVSLIVACSHTYNQPETIGSKMARYRPSKSQVSKVPQFKAMPISKKQYAKRPTTRTPASMAPETDGSVINPYQNKRSYLIKISKPSFIRRSN